MAQAKRQKAAIRHVRRRRRWSCQQRSPYQNQGRERLATSMSAYGAALTCCPQRKAPLIDPDDDSDASPSKPTTKRAPANQQQAAQPTPPTTVTKTETTPLHSKPEADAKDQAAAVRPTPPASKAKQTKPAPPKQTKPAPPSSKPAPSKASKPAPPKTSKLAAKEETTENFQNYVKTDVRLLETCCDLMRHVAASLQPVVVIKGRLMPRVAG